MRDRLIELVKNAHDEQQYLTSDKSINAIADFLLENGVIVPPCKVGDIVYKVMCTNSGKYCGVSDFDCDDCPYQNRQILEGIVIALKYVKGIRLKVKFNKFTDYFCDDEVYYAKEEAEQALKKEVLKMAKCYECIEYKRCLLKCDEDALNLNDGMEVCRGFAHKDICGELISHIGETIYKICPKCNPDHNESCNRCAWKGCMSLTGCDVFGLWEDGQYPAEECTIVPKIIHWNFIPAIAKELGNKAFLNRDDAVRKLESLKALKGGTE